jgi:hypothetical protein
LQKEKKMANISESNGHAGAEAAFENLRQSY